MFVFPLHKSFIPAYSTDTVSSWVKICIGFAEGVTIYAIGLRCIFSCRACSSENIFSHANYLKMVRVYTSRISTQMIECHIWLNNPIGKFIGEAMGYYSFSAVEEEAVASSRTSKPLPAFEWAADLYFSPEMGNSFLWVKKFVRLKLHRKLSPFGVGWQAVRSALPLNYIAFSMGGT